MRAQLVPLDGGEPIEITKDLTVVGRKEDADLRLDHKSVSKLHCVIVRTDGLLLIRDLGSTNGTRVNGQRVRRAALLPNDQLSIASFRYKVYLGPGDAAPPVPQNFDQHTQQMDAKDVANLLRKATAKAKEIAPPPANGNHGLAPLTVQPNVLPDVYTDDKGEKDSRLSEGIVMPWSFACVVFDLDGLLVDTERIFEEAARRLLARRGRELRRDILRAMIGTPSQESLPWFRAGHQLSDSIEDLAAECRSLFFDVLGTGPAPLLPGVVELLERLKTRAVPLAIATSSSAAYVEKVLGPHGLLPRFRFVLTFDDVRRGKPAPEIYEKAAARFGQSPAAMVVLEDSLNGLRSAKAAGARCVVVPHELIDVTEMTAADAIVPSLAAPELAELLGL